MVEIKKENFEITDKSSKKEGGDIEKKHEDVVIVDDWKIDYDGDE
ncbi:MAG: hypothetical protein V1855_03890 [bacterium]